MLSAATIIKKYGLPVMFQKKPSSFAPHIARIETWFHQRSVMVPCELIARILVSILFIYSECSLYENYLATDKISSLLLAIEFGLVAAMVLVRNIPKSFSISPIEWLVAWMATLAPGILGAYDQTEDVLFPVALQLTGIVFATLAIASLNRSFGIIPANRGVKKGGLYRIVRHPIYAGYFMSNLGFILNEWHVFNIIIFVSWLIFLVPRILMEEAHLSKDAEYLAFKEKTRWRLIPYVW
jgi:protein-S-isoprenylcysteine O-methyltransferase Ste14